MTDGSALARNWHPVTDGSALARNWHPVSLAQLIEAHGDVEEIHPVGQYPVRIPRLPPRKPKA